MRSTLRRQLVNEARIGYSGAPVTFFGEMNTGMFTAAGQAAGLLSCAFRPSTRADQALADAPAPQSRNANSLLIEDTVTLAEGLAQHQMGGVVHPVRHLGEELNAGAEHQLRRADERSGERAVHGGELPGRVDGKLTRRATSTRC